MIFLWACSLMPTSFRSLAVEFLCLSCQVGIAQLFPFAYFIDAVFPRDRQLNNEDAQQELDYRTRSECRFVIAISGRKAVLTLADSYSQSLAAFNGPESISPLPR